ncbi:MAG: GIY-YIG nuclease family protein [Patescibacteria group bacterium]|jgi:putative endonuclease
MPGWPACKSYRFSDCGQVEWNYDTNDMYYTYVLKSASDQRLYVGWTTDLGHRLEEHNSGLVESTKNRRPLLLMYYEACLSKEKAIAREKQLKTGFGRKYLNKRI